MLLVTALPSLLPASFSGQIFSWIVLLVLAMLTNCDCYTHRLIVIFLLTSAVYQCQNLGGCGHIVMAVIILAVVSTGGHAALNVTIDIVLRVGSN